MQEQETKINHPSLPPNYVSLAHLQEQWLKKKQQKKEQEEQKQKQIGRERETERRNQEIAARKQIGQFRKGQRQGNYVKNGRYVEKYNLGRFERGKEEENQEFEEKSNLGRFERETEMKNQEIRHFQQHQREGNSVKSGRYVKKSNLGRFEKEKEQKNQEIGQFQQHQREGNYVKNGGNVEKSNLGRFEREIELKNQEFGQFQQHQREGNYGRDGKNVGKSNLGRFERETELKNQEIEQFQQHQREGNYVKNGRNMEKSNLGRFEREKEQNNQEIGQFQQHQREGNYVKNGRNVEKSNLGRFEKEKEQKIQEIGGEKGIGQCQKHQREGDCVKNGRNVGGEKEIGLFQHHQREGNYGKNGRNVEKSSLGRFEREKEQKNQEIGGVKEIEQFQKHLREGDYVKSKKNVEKSKLGRFQGSERSGYKHGRSYNENQENGVYKDKGKGKLCEVGEGEVDSVLHRREERCDGKFRQNGSGGVGSEVFMCGYVVAVEADESVGIKKPEDGLRGGLKTNVGDLRVNSHVLEKVGKGESLVESKEGLERGKKSDEETARVGERKKMGSLRPSRESKGTQPVNLVDTDNVGKLDGVEEKEEVLEGKEKRNVGGYKKKKSKKGRSRKFVRGTEEGQGNGRGVAEEENGIQLDLDTNNGEQNGEEGSGDNVRDEKVARPRERKHNRASVGRRNVNGRVIKGSKRGYEVWSVKVDSGGTSIIKNIAGEKSGNNRSVEEIQVIENERNGREDNIIEKKENDKQEVSGEQTKDEVMMMTNEANGEKVMFRGEVRENWDKKRFSSAYVRRDFKELPLNGRRVVGNARNSGLVWVKKGDTDNMTLRDGAECKNIKQEAAHCDN